VNDVLFEEFRTGVRIPPPPPFIFQRDMKKERRKYLDLISRNLSVCSRKTIDEVLNSLESDERNYVSELIEKIRTDGTDNN